MTRIDSDPEQTDFQRGYEAARTGKVSHRHGRYWIDDNSAELARPEVVKGIMKFYRDAAQVAEYNEAFERVAIERHDDIH